jgi:4-amino-4-deoxy-L-arabinose transferase-like glycosyltransferase
MKNPPEEPAAPSPRASGISRPGWDTRLFAKLLLFLLVVRLAYAGMMELVPDEAFYWVWSRHLAAGYLDHPPAIAYLIWLGTHVVGSNELGVRLVGLLMALGAIVITVWLGRRILRDARATRWVALIWLTSPLLAGLGTIFTPDTPVTFFSVCAMAFVAMIADRDDQSRKGGLPPPASAGLWLLFGLFSGLAMLSKYTGVLLPASIALAMLFSRDGRNHYRRPWIYLSGILAVVVFSPVIWWNARHQWVSFLYQLNHGTTSQDVPKMMSGSQRVVQFFQDIGTYIGGQAGVWTPVLFGISLVVLWYYWRRYRTVRQVDRVLLWAGTLPLVLFGAAAIRAHHTEANWPAFSYFPISLLIVRWLSESWSAARVNWVRGGVQVAVGILVVMHLLVLPPITRAILHLPYRVPHVFKDLVGHRQEGEALGKRSAAMLAPVFTNRHEDAGEASFYMPHQPEVWCIGIGFRPTAYDYFDEKLDFGRIPRVLWLGRHVGLFEKKYGYAEQEQSNILFYSGRNSRTLTTYLLVRITR